MIKKNLLSEKIRIRLITSLIILLIVFFSVTILSYFLLPEGVLAKKNSVSSFNTSTNIWLCALQIFAFNMISVVFIFIGSLFSKCRGNDEEYMGYGYYCLFLLVIMNAITLGTWSFSANMESVSLFKRIVGSFIVTQNAGLLEMIGQMFICCSLANKSLVMINKKEVHTRTIRQLSFTKYEYAALIIGLLLMFLGAFIESRVITG